ncbi:Rieske [2Fe-2S] iron-sulfur domain-containing protein [Hyaloraphidium curvatum]|nr:Rieske [2Fe-2S] iron-sulfur domain-containing protein [Hyaloraphidium curvatum]
MHPRLPDPLLHSPGLLPICSTRRPAVEPALTPPFPAVPTGAFSQRRLLHSTPALRQNSESIPDFSYYKRSGDQDTNRAFTYAMIGSLGAVSAVGTKATLVDWLSSLSASADVLALAKVEVDLTSIPEGKNVILKWRGKPVFIRHRTQAEIEESNNVSLAELRDPETDIQRAPKQEWLVMLGVCTHLGCVPIGDAGDYHGWFCPCHGSHYDISGRIRKGPAPLNLEIPPYEFIEDDTKVVIG